MSEQENETPDTCNHEWVKTDSRLNFSADHSAETYSEYYKCKLCGEEAVEEHTEYHGG
jgi:hypothetical protein